MVLSAETLHSIVKWLQLLNEEAPDQSVSLGTCEVWDQGELVGKLVMTDVDTYDFEPALPDSTHSQLGPPR